jgi:hypothetical protein
LLVASRQLLVNELSIIDFQEPTRTQQPATNNFSPVKLACRPTVAIGLKYFLCYCVFLLKWQEDDDLNGRSAETKYYPGSPGLW